MVVQLIDSNQIFFINFSEGEGSPEDLATIIQYMLFFMVPVFALATNLFYRKRKAYFIEYLILSFHIHTVWFVLLIIELFTLWLEAYFEQSWIIIIAEIIKAPAQLATFIYLLIYLKKTFHQGWLISLAKSVGIMIIYMMVLVGFIALYFIITEG